MNNQHRMKSQHQEVARPKIGQMSDQDVTQRYAQELRKLRIVNQYGRHSERFLGYPNTLVMKRCRRELERRNLPIPPVNPPGKDKDHAEHRSERPATQENPLTGTER